jgi:hypothetical protein
MRKYIVDILEEVNKEPDALAKYREDAALKFLFQYAFIPEQKFDLPEGDPPFKPDPGPIGMTPTNFTQEVRKLYIFTKARELPRLRREQLFIQLLESVHPSEAKLLLAVKDQKLNKLYKNVTAKLASDYGFIPVQVKKKNEESTPKKS